MSTPFLEVDPDAETTWQNHPRPGNFADFERELLEIGGTHTNGRPVLELAWGPDCKRIRLGKLRHEYVDDRIPCRRKVEEIVYKIKDLEGPADAEYRTVTEEEFNALAEPSRYFYHALPQITVRTIARQQFIVRQYFPPDKLVDTPETWEARRWREFTPPETNSPEFGDDTGPFPAEGLYMAALFVARRDNAYGYREPGRDVLEALREAWARREQFHRDVSPERQVANVYAAYEEQERKERELLDQRLKEDLKHFERKMI